MSEARDQGGFVIVKTSGIIDIVSGIYHSSGINILAKITGTSGLAMWQDSSGVLGVTILSGEIAVSIPITSGSIIVSGIVGISGSVSIHSGLIGILSGNLTAKTSGENAVITSGVVQAYISGTVAVSVPITSGSVIVSGNVGVSGSVIILSGNGPVAVNTRSGFDIRLDTPDTIRVVAASVSGTNPLYITANSGGVLLSSGDCQYLIARFVPDAAYSGHHVYLGSSGNATNPYSGRGMVLAWGDGIRLDIDNFNKVACCATLSGARIAYIGVQGFGST